MMIAIESEIKSRLYFNYKYNDRTNGNTLNETHGIPDVAEYITNQFRSDVKRLYGVTEPYQEKVVKRVDCYLCNKVIIHFEVNMIGSNGVKAGFLPRLSVFNREIGKYDCIIINCNFREPLNGINEILAQIAHEVTHAVENFNRLTGDKESLEASITKKGYFRNIGGRQIVEQKLKYILYHTMSTEQNAYVAGIIEEIKPYLLDCDTSEKAYKCLEKSTVYKNILKMQEWVDDLKYLSDADKKCAIDYCNKVLKTNMTTYMACYKKILKRWAKFRKKLSVNLSKQITDIAMSSDKWAYLQPVNTFPLDTD